VVKRAGVVLVVCAATAWVAWPRAAYPHNPTTTTVLFNREIATLLQRKCVQCHAQGKMAMPLVTYDQARPWAEAIKEETLARRMPPWPAERGYGTYSNDIGLTPREFEFLLSWIDGGVPAGTGDAPAVVDHGAHWTLGAPDLVVSPSHGASIDARSAPAFTRIIIDTGLTRDTLVRALDFKPDPRVTRAAFFSVAGTDRYLGGWTPWQPSTELPSEVAFRIPARAQIAVDVLYAGTAQRAIDTPQLGLYFAPGASGVVATSTLRPGASDAHTSQRIVAEMKITEARSLLSLRPQLRPGGRSLEVKLLRPDGSSQVLLWVKDFRQDWQTPYVFAKPVAMPAGSVVQAIAYFAADSGADPSGARSNAPFSISLNSYATK
jgi:hypothetical protein